MIQLNDKINEICLSPIASSGTRNPDHRSSVELFQSGCGASLVNSAGSKPGIFMIVSAVASGLTSKAVSTTSTLNGAPLPIQNKNVPAKIMVITEKETTVAVAVTRNRLLINALIDKTRMHVINRQTHTCHI